MSDKEWNELANTFDAEAGEAFSADNVQIAWPIILNELPSGGSILDFGCGTGSFCRHLVAIGYEVTGIDPSKK